ncbi:peptidylprolyl isomerase [Coleofasciculus sp. FACHB-1120]|uniref:peptidylprolyl isomerase n=1 Tax=Coleofasciculus sp. FACHB-1120 TaxID=2692783 RepID=UPI001682AE11|nr:peptidylprolyl isomerase [Coleofasciculus sp. FACHB-1120]MBD2740551.1 peptidylprolyl isomerase [Coleofasciculus sp. FACHB-1120]
MNDFSGSSVEVDEIVSFLKKDIQLKEVCQKILYQKIITQAAQERSLTVTPEEIQAEANKLRYAKRLEKAADTLAWLAEQMIASEDWEEGIRDRLISKKLAESLFAKEAEKFFAQNKLNFDQIILYQMILPDERLAQELFYQIEEREISFYEAAHLYDSDERRRYQCGYEGKLYRWSFKPDLSAIIFSAKRKEVFGPISTEQGYHLFMVEEFSPAQFTPQTHQEIMDRMFKEWLASELNYMLHSTTD